MIKRTKKLMTLLLTLSVILGVNANVLAADNDGWTEARKTTAAENGEWDKWCNEWNEVKNNPTQISLTPGKDETELNFSWYSKNTDKAPKFKFGKDSNLKDGKEITVVSEDAVAGYKSNKCTATGLTENTTYYYSYTVDGKWIDPICYKSGDKDEFDILFVGDPQIGSSSGNIASEAEEEQGQNNASRNDSFNLRYGLVPIFENNDIDVVLTGHDHTYSRSHILSGGHKDKDLSKLISGDDFEKYAEGEIKEDKKYEDYLSYVEDENAVEVSGEKFNKVVNPQGILYITANSASGSKYYDLVDKKQSYIASRWQEDVPTYSDIHISDEEFAITTYRTDNGEKIDDTFTIIKK